MNPNTYLFVAICIIVASSTQGWWSKRRRQGSVFKKHHVNCHNQRSLDLRHCHRNLSPCNPNFQHPCGNGCKDMCCAKDFPTKNWLCFRKGECGQFCYGLHGWWNTKGRCGCRSGLRCHKNYWYQAKKCKP